MKSKESNITLLKEQLAQVTNRNFDLSSWKKATSLLLTSLFGPHSAEVNAIEKIDYAYSSWTLRDESGTIDPVKKECLSTLKVIIRKFELDDNTQDAPKTDNDFSFVWLPFEDELTGATLKKLKASINTPNITEEEISKLLKDLPGQVTIDILSRILLAPEFKNWLSA